MHKVVFLTLLLTAAVLAASSVETGPTEQQVPPWQHLWNGLAPVDQGQSNGTNIVVKSPEPDWAPQGSGGTKTPSEFDDPGWQQPPRYWGNDVLVGEHIEEASGRISVDNDDSTGDIYVCLYNQDATTADTAHIWRSTDGGATWQVQLDIIGSSTVGDLTDAQILCGHGPGDTTWLYIVSAASKSGLRIRRTTPDGSVWHWVTIDTTTTVVRVAIDRNIESPEHLFCVWNKANGDIRAMSSTDAGATWGNAVLVSAGRRGVSCAAGGDGYVYLAYMDDTDSSFYRIGRATNNLVSPSWVFLDVDSNATDYHFREVSIAADRTTPGTSQSAIAFATCRHSNNNIGPRYSWTMNGGTSWSSSFWPVTNQSRLTWQARFTKIRRSYDSNLFRAIVSMPETTASWDTIVYAYAYATAPDSWAARGTYNDYRNTGEVSHDVGYSSLTSGGLIAYRQFASGKVWFDGYSFTGVAENPTPAQPRRMTTVFGRGADLMLSRRAQVKASVYDRDGRLARELFNGTLEAGQHRLDPGVTDGVCFLRVTVDGKTETAKLVRLQ